METYSELLKAAPLLISSSNKRDNIIKVGDLCRELEKILKCPTNPHLKFALKLELAQQKVDYKEIVKDILLYYKPYLSVHQIIMTIYTNLTLRIEDKEECKKTMESLYQVQEESQMRMELISLQKSSDTLDHFLNTQYEDTISRNSSLNPYQLRYIITQYKERQAEIDSMKSKLQAHLNVLDDNAQKWKEINNNLDLNRHKGHLDKLIDIYQKRNISRVKLSNLDEEIDNSSNVSVNLIDPHAQPSPKLIQRFSFSIPDEDPTFSDVMDELQIVHATEQVTNDKSNPNTRQFSINHLEDYLEFKKADMASIPELDLHLELLEKTKQK
eukprot:NODE_4_length_55019_cov_0.425091.p19 type:complete len:327 gc:universal NODE_4_length_55019_cov_0.425091:5554-6534(+)